MANKIQIEDIGIEAVKKQLRNSPNIDATKLFHNDKTQSWDGDLFLYKNSDWKKDDLIGKIPTQVKARTVQKFSKQISSLSMSKADLRNYKNDGGVILFKVEIIGDESKVFFNSLMPFDLEIILKRIKPTVESATISLNEMTLNDALSFSLICKKFLSDKSKQMPIVNFEFPEKDIKQIHIEGIVKPGTSISDFLTSGEHYIYGKRHEDDDLYQYVTKAKFVDVKEKHIRAVCLDSIEYYSYYEIKKDDGIFRLLLGENLELIFHKDRKEVELKYRTSGNLKNRVNDIGFILTLDKSKQLQIGDGYFPVFGSGMSKNVIKELKSDFEYYNNAIRVMDYFGIEPKEVDLSNAPNKDFKALDFLIDIIVNKNDLPSNANQQGKSRIKIGNIDLLVFILKMSDGKYVLKDINELADRESKLSGVNGNGEKEETPSSIFVLLDIEDIIKCNNINMVKAINDIKRYKYHPMYVDLVIRLALNLIHTFDKTNNTLYLKYADELFDWIEDGGFDEDMITINKLQISVREGKLTINEKRILKKMLVKVNDMKKCGIYILLNDIDSFKNSFKKLDGKLQEEFKGYPIYKLIKK